MTLVPFSTLIPDVGVNAMGCPDTLIEGYLRKSAIRTCERTHYWRMMLPVIRLVPGVWTYQFTTVPDGAEVFSLMSATMNGEQMVLLPPDELVCCFPEWSGTGTSDASVSVSFEDAVYNIPEYEDSTLYNSVLGAVTRVVGIASGSHPKAISRMSPCTFIVLPKPNADIIFYVRPYVTLRPTKDATGMDDCVMGDLAEIIVHGALQELLLLPSTHWTDRELATYHAKQYLFKLTERRARANLGFSRSVLVAHGQPFGV
jgi:hypothetical protein